MSVYYQVTVWYESATHPGVDAGDRRPTHRDRETFDDLDEVLPWLRKRVHVKVETLKRGGRETFWFRHDEEVEARTFGYWCGPDRRGNRWFEWATVIVERLENEPVAYPEVVDGYG